MKHLAFCGDDCTLCPRYIASQSGDIEALRKAADIWFNVGWMDVTKSPEDMVCHGCLTVGKCVYGIRECALAKGVENCGRCDDYPCDISRAAFKRNKAYELICQAKCSEQDYAMLARAFFNKRTRLDAINEEYRKQDI